MEMGGGGQVTKMRKEYHKFIRYRKIGQDRMSTVHYIDTARAL